MRCLSFAQCNTVDDFIIRAMLYLKTLVIVYMWFTDKRIMVWYLIAYIGAVAFSISSANFNYRAQALTSPHHPSRVKRMFTLSTFQFHLPHKPARVQTMVTLSAFE